jgi:serine/threonine protein phosphatase PrpC
MLINCLFSGRTPKESETISDCQDYFMANEAEGCFALADGASQSFYPSIWAELLVNNFCENPEINSSNWEVWLEIIQQRWFLAVDERVKRAKSQNRPTWIEGYNGISAKRSATSTFIGLEFSADKVKVCIVGDSCLFVFKNEEMQSYQLEHSDDFNDRPEYLASYSKDNHFKPHFFEIPIDFGSGNITFVLATDALAEYILKCHEREKKVLPQLLKISSGEDFEDFVAFARYDNVKMKNDDVTLLVLSNRVSSSHENLSKGDRKSWQDSNAIKPELNDGSNSAPHIQNDINCTQNPKSLKSFFSMVPWDFLNVKPNQKTTQPATDPKIVYGKVVSRLKGQRAILFTLLALVSPFVVAGGDKIFGSKSNQLTKQKASQQIAQKVTSSSLVPEFITLSKNTTVFADDALKSSVLSTSSTPEVLVLKKGEKMIKFQIDIYAHKTTVNSCSNCSGNEIEIQSGKKLRIFPNMIETDIFGQLKNKAKFQKVKFNSLPDWYKFRFVGYIVK